MIEDNMHGQKSEEGELVDGIEYEKEGAPI
jgi:hypothetical protein